MRGAPDRYVAVLATLFADYGVEMTPADPAGLDRFRHQAAARGVPGSVVDELTELYRVTDGVPVLDGFCVHPCGDEVLFEWWDRRELWVGTRHDDVMRWVGGSFCLGDASNASHTPAHEFPTLYELIASTLAESG